VKLLVVAIALLGSPAVAQAPPRAAWRAGEGFGFLVERGSLEGGGSTRELVLVSALRSPKSAPLLAVVGIGAASGRVTCAYRVELDEASLQPRTIEPIALRFDGDRVAFGIKPDGATQRFPDPPAANALATVPGTAGATWLPCWAPPHEGPVAASGSWLDFCADPPAVRPLRCTSRRDPAGALVAEARSADGGALLVAHARFDADAPVPSWGEWIDSARRERGRFRRIFHCPDLAYALALGRGAIAGDPLLLPPEAVALSESTWMASIRDQIAEEALASVAAARKLRRIAPRPSPVPGELVPWGYELFALAGSPVATPGISGDPQVASPRGVVSLVFVARLEETGTGVRYEAWCLPGVDERAREADSHNPAGESPGRWVLRTVLGRSPTGLFSSRGFALVAQPGWFDRARRTAHPGKTEDAEVLPSQGSDVLLLRREIDLAPVALVRYRLESDLRSVTIVERLDLDGSGPVSAVRRSQLDRPKDFFVAGGFTAFTYRPGASVLLTREEGTVSHMELVGGRGCSLEMLAETSLPEEPWKIPLVLGPGRSPLWGSPTPLALGRNRFGDARLPRDAIVRRSDGEEVIAYEEWVGDGAWWDQAFAAFPKQGFGVRFRPLVHGKVVDSAPGEPIAFDPPEPPPQPKPNPKTHDRPPKEKDKKPEPEKKPPAPPPPPSGPVTPPSGPVTPP